MRRAVLRRCPPALRARWAMRLSRNLVADTFRGSRPKARVRRGVGILDIRASIFCEVREQAPVPLCGYYVAAVQRFFEHCGIDASVQTQQCRAAGGTGLHAGRDDWRGARAAVGGRQAAGTETEAA